MTHTILLQSAPENLVHSSGGEAETGALPRFDALVLARALDGQDIDLEDRQLSTRVRDVLAYMVRVPAEARMGEFEDYLIAGMLPEAEAHGWRVAVDAVARNDPPPEDAWAKAAGDLAIWTDNHLVNRRDAYGHYLAIEARTNPRDNTYADKTGLTLAVLERHFAGRSTGDLIGLYSTACDEPGGDGEVAACRSRWLAVDVDRHDDTVDPASTWKAAQAWYDRVVQLGFRPLLFDSNGDGGYHLLVVFDGPVPTERVYRFGKSLVRDWKDLGLVKEPETFPKQERIKPGRYGNFIRLPGRHHTREHFTRVWNGSSWLEGEAAVQAILATSGTPGDTIPAHAAKVEKPPQPSRGKPADDLGRDARLAAEALSHIKHLADSYDDWLRVGMSLTSLGAEGLALWDDWSRNCPAKYDEGACRRKWETLDQDRGLTVGTLFHEAKQNGWPGPAKATANRNGRRHVVAGESVPRSIAAVVPTLDQPADQDDERQLQVGDEPILTKRGEWVSCQHNSRIWMAEHDVSVRHNALSGDICVDGVPLRDETIAMLAGKIEADTRIPWTHKHIRDALNEVSRANLFNPLTDYLESLKWDQEPRLDLFFARVWGCEEHGDYAAACARVLFGSAVARAFKPGEKADAIVVIQGDQGTKKSSAVKELCPEDHLEWFAEDLGTDLNTEKTGNSLRGKWLIELGELNRVNRATIESVKHFLSQTLDRFKLPYDRDFTDQPRTCVFVATTNNKEPLIDDENRRFLPIWCPQVADLDWIKTNRDQLWAEAVVRRNEGVPWWVETRRTGKFEALVADRQAAACRIDELDGILAEGLASHRCARLEDVLCAAGISKDRYDRPMQTRLGNCLARIGLVRDKSPGWRHRAPIWHRMEPETL